MIETLIQYNSITYIYITLLCAIGYGWRTAKELRKDIKDRSSKFYIPEVTLGSIVTRVFICIIPGVNLIAFVFDLLAGYIAQLQKLLNIPLIPKKKVITND